MDATTSRIPALIDGLYATATAAVGAATTVVDGGPLQWDPVVVAEEGVSERSFLFIGARPDDLTSAEATDDRIGAASSREEKPTVYCTAYVRGDTPDYKPARDAVFTLIAVLESALRTDQTVAGAVAQAHVGAVEHLDQWRPARDDCAVLAVFPVTATAFLA